MATETPYGLPFCKPTRSADVKAANAATKSSAGAVHWVFPGLRHPPVCRHGEVVLSSGAHQAGNWHLAWAQIVGTRHRHSEDSLGVCWQGQLPGQVGQGRDEPITLALADGVGGGARGDLASHALVHHCLDLTSTREAMPTQADLAHRLALADSAVNRALVTATTKPGAATLAAAWLDKAGQGWICRVGDARLSVLDAITGELSPLLADQNYANLGETPPCPDDLRAPARMVGAGLIGVPEIVPFSLRSGETLVLSSDGLHEWLSAKDAVQIASGKLPLIELAKAMAHQARHNGSDDDISVLLARNTAS